MRYKVRFNLAFGKNTFKMWQVRDNKGLSYNYEPSKVTLVMTNCELQNNKEAAQKIFDGGTKTVCAWLLCDTVEVLETPAVVGTKDGHLMYNPEKTIHWVMDGKDMDGEIIPMIYSSGRELYVPQDPLKIDEDDN